MKPKPKRFGAWLMAAALAFAGAVQAADLTITDLEGLKGFRDAVNGGDTFAGKTVVLAADIDLASVESWTPIGTSSTSFAGTFDGNGKTIANLTIATVSDDCIGFFQTLAAGSLVKNVNFVNAKVSGHLVGILCGEGKPGATAEDIRFDATSSVTATKYAGSIGVEFDGTLRRILNHAPITSTGDRAAGGIVAWTEGEAQVLYCTNTAKVVANGWGAGGITANATGSRVEGCVNVGDVSTIAESGEAPAGGIVCRGSGATISHCLNTGNVSTLSDNENSTAGGILGLAANSAVNVLYCENRGNVHAECREASGIVSSLYGATISYCLNAGEVASPVCSAAGVSAKPTHGTSSCSKCVNEGSITGASADVTYELSQSPSDSYYYSGDKLLKNDGTETTAGDALAVLNGGTDASFFKIGSNGKLTTVLEYVPETPVAYVAEIVETGVKYATLEEAAEAATAGEMLRLLSDVDLTGYAKNSFVTIPLEGVTLDLNGKTISVHNGGVAYDGSDVTISNGTFVVVGDANQEYAIHYGNGEYGAPVDNVILENIVCRGGINVFCASVTLRNVTVELPSSGVNRYYAVWADEAAHVTIESGEYTATSTHGERALLSNAYGMESAGSIVDDSSLTVLGGTFDARGEHVATGNTFIMGGTFNKNPECVADGYEAVPQGTTPETYKVLPASFYQDAENANLWHVRNLAGLKKFRDAINEHKTSFMDKTIQIDDDIDMTEEGSWTAIKAYQNGSLLARATIDGKGHTIKGMKIVTPDPESGYVYGGGFIDKTAGKITIKDLAFEGASVTSTSGSQVGIVVGMSYDDVTMDNVDLKDCVVTGNTKTGLYVGQNDDGTVTIRNCDVVNSQAKANYSAALLIGLLNVNSNGAVLENNTVDEASKFVWIDLPDGATRDAVINGRYYYVSEADAQLIVTDPGEKCLAEQRIAGAQIRYKGKVYTTVWGSKFYPELDFEAENFGMKYETVAAAADEAIAGDTIKLLKAASGEATLPNGVTFNTNDNKWEGTLKAEDGSFIRDNGDGTFTAVTAIAEIGEQGYESLVAAIAAVEDDQTITLVCPAEEYAEANLRIDNGKTFEIDFGGKMVNTYFNCYHGNVTLRNGTIVNGQPFNVWGSANYEDRDTAYNVLTIAEDVQVLATHGYGIIVWGVGNSGYYPFNFGTEVNVYGKIYAEAPLWVIGNLGMDNYYDNTGTLKSVEDIKTLTGKKVSAIMAEFGPKFNVYDGAEMDATGEVSVEDSTQGLTINGMARVTVHGGTIIGNEGIGMKCGILDVRGGKIVGCGAKCDPVIAVNSGNEKSGAGIAVSTYYNANSSSSITITGGMIESQNNAAFLVAHSHKSGKPVKVTQGVIASVRGGTFIGGEGQSAILVEPILEGEEGKYPANFISAKLDEEGKETGYPLCNSPIPTEYIAVGYKEKDNENKTWTVTAVSQEIVVVPEPIAPDAKKCERDDGEPPTDAEKTAADKAVQEIEAVYQEQVLTKVEGTGIAGAAVEPPTQPGEQPKLKPSVVDALNLSQDKPLDVTILAEDGSNSWSHLVIKLKSTTTKVVTETETETIKTSVNEMKVDVKPIIQVTPIREGVELPPFEVEMPNEAIPSEGITFPLFVSEAFRGKWARVQHAAVGHAPEDYVTEVLGDEKSRPFVMITAKHFSEWLLSVIETSSKAVKRADGKLYDTLAEAIADSAADETFTLLMNTEEKAALKKDQTIVTNGKTFGGIDSSVLDPGGWTEPVNTDGKVFIAPVKANVPVSDEEGAPVIRVRMCAEGVTTTAANVAALKDVKENGRPLWQNMALGVANNFKLIPMIPRSEIGFKTIKICSNLDEATLAAAAKVRDGVAVKFQLLKKVGAGDYVQCGEVQDKPVFNVEADNLEPRTFWKIQTIFSEEY